MALSYVPRDLRTLTPSLNLRNAAKALEFYRQIFGARERFVMRNPDGTVMHGEFQIGDSVLMFCDEAPDFGALSPQAVGGCPLSLNIYVPDCDAVTAAAQAAGAELLQPPATHAWGERVSMIRDPFGYRWAICTQVEDVSPDEIRRRLDSGWKPAD